MYLPHGEKNEHRRFFFHRGTEALVPDKLLGEVTDTIRVFLQDISRSSITHIRC